MIPLSEKMRPTTLFDIAGQIKSLHFAKQIIESKKPLSLLLYGPPGSGKTTLARIYAAAFDLPFVCQTAVFNSSAEIKKMLKETGQSPLFSRQIILFVDEIHRFTKAQQDLFLPFLEDGSLILIGATTENPSFTLNNALLSRMRVLKFDPLSNEDLSKIIERYERCEKKAPLTEELKRELIETAAGDGRHLFNMLENLEAGLTLQKRPPLYDKSGEQHYNLISALHKSIRGSDPDAALYWLCRMLLGGEEPRYLCRRLIRMALEDIGMADPQALQIALQAHSAYEMLGSPEGDLALAQAVLYLALAPKSNAVYVAYGEAKEKAQESGHKEVPLHIINAPNAWMASQGYGQQYQYDPDTPYGFSGQNYFPGERMEFYRPVERGFEREMKKRLQYFSKLREHLNSNQSMAPEK